MLHLLISLSSFIAFLVALGGSLYATILLKSGNLNFMFGGTGVAAVLGIFTYFSLGNVRAAQISLALFESFVAEVRINLAEAEKKRSSEDRLRARSAAWHAFRSGLNELWFEENKRNKEWALQYFKKAKSHNPVNPDGTTT